MEMTSQVMYYSGSPQLARRHSNTGAPHSKHFRNDFVSQKKFAGFYPIMDH
jgi:hypothetical protein